MNNVSVRKNRDYSEKVCWTEEINKILYQMYLFSKENPDKRGYTITLKRLWDEKYSELSHLTVNHIAQQARRIEKRLLKKGDTEEEPVQEGSNDSQPPEETAKIAVANATPQNPTNNNCNEANDDTENTTNTELYGELKSKFLLNYRVGQKKGADLIFS